MTPKDKAKELIDKFYLSRKEDIALIAVDEIIDILEDEGFTFTKYHDKKTLEFWLEVKNEINKL